MDQKVEPGTGNLFRPWGSIDRLKGISDDIFAFAMTLLILGIHIPDLPKDVGDYELLRDITSRWPEFATYAISFLNISNYWMLHHGIFAYLAHTNRTLTRLNLLFLLTVTFLPYPTALHGKFGNQSSVALVYGLTIALNYAMLLLISRYAYNKPKLLDPDFGWPIKKLLTVRILVPLGLAVAGTLVAFYFVRLSFLFFALVPLSNAIPARWLVKEQD